MKVRILLLFVFVVFLINCISTGTYNYTIDDINSLESEAKEIAEMTNVSARKYYEVYMRLGEAYYQYERYILSLESLKKGLRLKARDYEHQMLAAKIEYELGQIQLSYYRLNQIINNADSKKIRKQAEKLINEISKMNLNIDEVFIPDMSHKYIYVVTLGKVDTTLVTALKNRIEDEFHITVREIEDTIIPSKNRLRDRHEEYFRRVTERYIENNDQETYEAIIDYIIDKNGAIKEEDIDKEFVYYLYLKEKHGQELWEENMSKIQDQYHADVLLNQVRNQYKDLINENNCFGILGVTQQDIYTKDYNFLFGWNSSDVAIMSYQRFINDNTTLTVKIKRTVMQGFSSVGYLIGIPRCSVDTCSRAYPHSLSEHDEKEDILCYECRENLIDVYNNLD